MSVSRITKEDLKQRLDAGDPLVIVDARLKYPFEHSTVTLPGALRLTPGHLDTSLLPRDRDLVVYDSDPGELVSAGIAEDLQRHGYRVSVLQGGIGDWVTAKLPTATKPSPQPAAIAAAPKA